MVLHIPLAHDFTCPWCWIGLFQAKRLREEFGATFDWIGYELYPEDLDWPPPSVPTVEPFGRPRIPSRLDLAYAAEGLERPTAERPKNMRIHNAHEAVEFAKMQGKADELVEILYQAYWLRGEPINEPQVLANLAKTVIENVPEMLKAVNERRFKDKIIGFDAQAYSTGIWNVPTFIIGTEKLAEQPYVAIKAAVQRVRALAAS